MATTMEQEFVVCGEHSLLYTASGSCPDCDGPRPKGVDYTTAQKVEIVEVDIDGQ